MRYMTGCSASSTPIGLSRHQLPLTHTCHRRFCFSLPRGNVPCCVPLTSPAPTHKCSLWCQILRVVTEGRKKRRGGSILFPYADLSLPPAPAIWRLCVFYMCCSPGCLAAIPSWTDRLSCTPGTPLLSDASVSVSFSCNCDGFPP